MNNDYNLLREFNLGQAQAGDEILHILSPSFTYTELLHEVKFKGVTSNLQEVFLEDKQGGGYVCGTQRVKMKPLCWVEGKPVYKGDVLYKTSPYTKAFTASSAFKDIGITNTEGRWCCSKYLTWSKPTVRHFHQNLIEAWENGVEIEFLNITGEWVYASTPTWNPDHSYRIKPQELEKKSGWINLWKAGYSTVGVSTGSSVYSSKEDALSGLYSDGHLGAIEIHWEE